MRTAVLVLLLATVPFSSIRTGPGKVRPAFASTESVGSVYHAWTVSVVVDSINNLRSGQVFSCLDPIPFGCDRADFYAVMAFIDGAGNPLACGQTAVIANSDFPRPGWTCQFERILAPATFTIAIWEFDRGL